MIRVFDAFSGIGGFRSAFERVGGFKTVGWCEIDRFAQKSYRAIFDTRGEQFYENIRDIDTAGLADFDLLVGGFPCQPFSVAGKRLGTDDERGDLFFELARIEMTGLTRCQAAKAIAKVLGGTPNHEGGSYDKYTVDDEQGREWSIVYDGSIRCVDANGNYVSKSYSVELNSPVLGYEDIPLLQEVIRALRHAKGRCGPEYCCGTHIHISADDYTPQQIRNLVNIFASKEDFLWDALQVSSAREGYCAKVDKQFVEELNRKKPKNMEKIKKLWYRGNMNEQYRHYSNFRYRALNLHSFFQHGHYEIRCCNASLHAGEVRAQIVLALAISNAAMTKKYCLPSVSHSDNMRYSFRVWLMNLGLIGDEYKNCRTHLLKHLSGNIAWRHPEDAIAQRERLRQARITAREEAQQNESPGDERVATVCDDRQEVGETPNENLEAAVSDCDDFEETKDEGMAMSM